MTGKVGVLRRRVTACLASIALLSGTAATAQRPDPDNPTCPLHPNWSSYPRMRFTVQQVDGREVLLAEGVIDDDMIPRLEDALKSFGGQEIWLRSPGGSARIGNQAGLAIRRLNLSTHVPAGWACLGSCAFMFMGGIFRSVDAGGQLIVRMFTHVSDPPAVERQMARWRRRIMII